MNEVYHIPALLPQALESLNIKPSGTYVDATFGGGGHSRAIVECLGEEGHLYSFDQDLEAVANAFDDSRFTIVHGNFRFMRNFLRYYEAGAVDGILADLGVSFHHFDDPDRGFSFRFDGPLDMRMNRDAKLSAADIVNGYSEQQLADIFYMYGELKSARRIASAIVKARVQERITTTEQLIATVDHLLDRRDRKTDLAKLFQALRIEVNHELDALKQLLEQSVKALRPGGRLVVITYHSLEDRLVKNFMRTGNIRGEEAKDFFGRNLSPFKLVTSKPIVPDAAEIESNPRSRSAKMRVAQLIEQS
ncbi:MAG: 16S rRNA (cytosine(1402)-N(4))-methyltransferase RsmH [Muribaculaceae bacterium]|nr:16S rRNA (cytosine(1402)-N(4))-methyltransferase RsmH [Muribaculaceae bacterium]